MNSAGPAEWAIFWTVVVAALVADFAVARAGGRTPGLRSAAEPGESWKWCYVDRMTLD